MGLRRFLVLGLAVVVMGCGNDGRTSTTAVPASKLGAMLLEARDVGAGWQVGSDVNDADFSDATKMPCADVTMDPTIAKRLTPVTGIQFEPTDRSYRHIIEFAVTGDAARLDADLRALFAAMESCSTVTSTTPGTLTVERLTIPELGDQRAAYTLTGTESPDATMTWYVRNADVRVGPVAIELGLTEILSTPEEAPHVSDGDFVKLLETAVAKLGN